ncbi:hypothetical protein [Streptomyces sp. NPDC053069]|uniref:hypothetical protein n=1 Tax=Streptomyces sp. NPDC053069 TaxID=3365695 RepID=UPI0037D88B6A
MSDSSDDTSSPPSQDSHAKKATIIAVVGIVLAAIPIAWSVIDTGEERVTESAYIDKADSACARHQSDLDALGPEPPGDNQQAYTAYLQRRGDIIRAALKDWGAVKVPSHLQGEINDAYFAADSAAKEWETAVHWGSQGNEDRANHYLDESSRYATDAIRKARSVGLKVCPLGF